jgi:hypothetical protein
VTRPHGLRRFDPLRPLELVSSLWASAAVAPVSGGAAVAYRTVFVTLRRLVVGRRVSVPLDDGELTLTVTKLRSRLDARALAVGQLGRVTVEAGAIRWRGAAFDAATAVLHDVHLRPSVPPVLVAAPVHLTLDIPAPALGEIFRWAAPRLTGEVGDDGVARMRWARRPSLGHVEVDTRLDGSTLWVSPRAVSVGRGRWALPARTPSYSAPLPDLPHGLQLTGITVLPGVIRLTGTLPHWQMDLPRTVLEDIVSQLGVVGRPLRTVLSAIR